MTMDMCDVIHWSLQHGEARCAATRRLSGQEGQRPATTATTTTIPLPSSSLLASDVTQM